MSEKSNKCFYCGKVIVRVGGSWIHRNTGIAACNRGDRHDPTPPQARPREEPQR